MSTRSMIIVKSKGKEEYKSVYCHFDGYYSSGGVGEYLQKYYNDDKSANEIIKLGDLSFLATKLNPTGKSHSFNTPEKDVTVAYGRDRGESRTKAQKHSSYKEVDLQEFNYLWDADQGQWFLISTSGRSNYALIPLKTLVK